jgi:uncharacterized protein YdhG (YjbR/CyaY superfamily)
MAAATVAAYLAALPEDRRAALEAVRQTIRQNLDAGYEEGIQYGMIGYYVPRSVYPAGYHVDPRQPLPFAALAAQKSHMALYLMCVYGDPVQDKWFRKAWAKTGKKLDMGKSCVRFKSLDDLPLEVVGELVRRVPAKAYVRSVEAALAKLGKAPKKKAAKPPKP